MTHWPSHHWECKSFVFTVITELPTVQQRELLSQASLTLPIFRLIGIMKLPTQDPKALAKIIVAIFNQISNFKIFIIFVMHLMCYLLNIANRVHSK